MTLPYFQVDTRNERLKTLAQKHTSLWQDFNDKLNLSWIYHDHGLEGVVLQPQELAAAIDGNATGNPSSTPYQEIKNLHNAIHLIRNYFNGRTRKERITRGLLNNAYQNLTESLRGVPDGSGLRSDDGRYGAYYHKFCESGEVEECLRRLLSYCNSSDVESSHPLVHATRFHFEFMKLMPYGKFSGRIARLITNLILMRYGYPPIVIHTVERARYYEALNEESYNPLLELMSESLTSTVESGLECIKEGIVERRRKREARKIRKVQREASQAKPKSKSKGKSKSRKAKSTSSTRGRKREAAKKAPSTKQSRTTSKTTQRKSEKTA